MINPKELRIGNFVDLAGQLVSVTEILSGCMSCTFHRSANMTYGYSAFRPIPLTEDWLVKLGFIKNGPGDPVLFELHNFSGYFMIWESQWTLKQNSLYHGVINIKWGINYVHQLQNLYFAMTGEELELKQ